jgi:hypothetical protein
MMGYTGRSKAGVIKFCPHVIAFEQLHLVFLTGNPEIFLAASDFLLLKN